jgi:hypothetical protein
MPLIELTCELGHRTERLVTRAEFDKPKRYAYRCRAKCDCEPTTEFAHICGSMAKRVEFSVFAPHFAPGGAGGFYKPSRFKMIDRADPTKATQNATGGKGLKGLSSLGTTSQIENP